jgi:hypothetical protein
MAYKMKTLINNLRWLLGLPFIGVAWVFYKIHLLIDPYTDWELDQYVDFIFDDFDDDEDCC